MNRPLSICKQVTSRLERAIYVSVVSYSEREERKAECAISMRMSQPPRNQQELATNLCHRGAARLESLKKETEGGQENPRKNRKRKKKKKKTREEIILSAA